MAGSVLRAVYLLGAAHGDRFGRWVSDAARYADSVVRLAGVAL